MFLKLANPLWYSGLNKEPSRNNLLLCNIQGYGRGLKIRRRSLSVFVLSEEAQKPIRKKLRSCP